MTAVLYLEIRQRRRTFMWSGLECWVCWDYSDFLGSCAAVAQATMRKFAACGSREPETLAAPPERELALVQRRGLVLCEARLGAVSGALESMLGHQRFQRRIFLRYHLFYFRTQSIRG
jgi:hypothetical protein